MGRKRGAKLRAAFTIPLPQSQQRRRQPYGTRIDLLRVNLAGDFGAGLPSNAGLTLIEARQDSGVEACELVAHLIRDARRQIADRLAGEAADVINETPAKIPRELKPAAPPRRAAKKTKGIASPPQCAIM